MNKNYKISLCMPCRNEASSLIKISKQIPKIVDEVIVIVNCSTDDSAQVAKSLGFKVVVDNRNIRGIGYGYAHITGMNEAKGDIIIGVDCDGSYPIDQIETILKYMTNHDLDFVSCNRYPIKPGTKIPLTLRLGVSLLNLETRLLYRIKVRDILSGMWLFKREIISQLQLTKGDWNLSPQIKINAATDPSIKFVEHSIQQYSRSGNSHQAYIKTGWSHLSWIFSNWFYTRFLNKSETSTHNFADVPAEE